MTDKKKRLIRADIYHNDSGRFQEEFDRLDKEYGTTYVLLRPREAGLFLNPEATLDSCLWQSMGSIYWHFFRFRFGENASQELELLQKHVVFSDEIYSFIKPYCQGAKRALGSVKIKRKVIDVLEIMIDRTIEVLYPRIGNPLPLIEECWDRSLELPWLYKDQEDENKFLAGHKLVFNWEFYPPNDDVVKAKTFDLKFAEDGTLLEKTTGKPFFQNHYRGVGEASYLFRIMWEDVPQVGASHLESLRALVYIYRDFYETKFSSSWIGPLEYLRDYAYLSDEMYFFLKPYSRGDLGFRGEFSLDDPTAVKMERFFEEIVNRARSKGGVRVLPLVDCMTYKGGANPPRSVNWHPFYFTPYYTNQKIQIYEAISEEERQRMKNR